MYLAYEVIAYLSFVWRPFSTKASRANNKDGELIITYKFLPRIRVDWKVNERKKEKRLLPKDITSYPIYDQQSFEKFQKQNPITKRLCNLKTPKFGIQSTHFNHSLPVSGRLREEDLDKSFLDYETAVHLTSS